MLWGTEEEDEKRESGFVKSDGTNAGEEGREETNGEADEEGKEEEGTEDEEEGERKGEEGMEKVRVS